ncbi:hypothetical protein DSO57_1027439 [Entomophthora muscae]|uniref:Uncharacterized protein n=1 Tax=Entomophthora muscae TaxID=34485 RepID=A0ACC2RGG8_9FUNG|nr:hypothetical protein DSO57_1027439 [Entomophthora muscae]
MEDIKKLVADLVAKQSAVYKENETITKGLIKVSSILDKCAKEMEDLEHFQQQITSIKNSSQRTQLASTSSNYQKAIDVNEPQKTLEQAKKKPRVLLRKPVVTAAREESQLIVRKPWKRPYTMLRRRRWRLRSLSIEELPRNKMKL